MLPNKGTSSFPHFQILAGVTGKRHHSWPPEHFKVRTGRERRPEDTAALRFGGRLEFLFWAGLSVNLLPLECLFCFDVGELQWHSLFPVLLVLSAQRRLLATSHGFCQKTRFQPGAALLIIIGCNYLTNPSMPRGTLERNGFCQEKLLFM